MEVSAEVKKMLKTSSPILPADKFSGEPYYGALFVRLAWQCSGTYRTTDYLGGCNGARIRFSPEKDWPVNVDLDKALLLLKPIKDRFGSRLSWADLIVLAGTVAIEEAGGRPMQFCGGRTDAEEGSGSEYLKPNNISGNFTSVVELKESMKIMGLSNREMTVLIGGGHSLGKKHYTRSGFNGPWTPDPTRLSNDYFQTLLSEEWEEFTVPQTGKKQFKAKGKDLFMLKADLMFKIDAEFLAITHEYASDNNLFLDDFAKAWTRMANADRFAGPTGNVCEVGDTPDPPLPPASASSSPLDIVV